ncbi:hypothetical protein MNB_SUP05-SYMBIONT-5-252 [hydrothermal vent metagenome]|uniref:Uncharacterized protein n=1 Tax=hydrothermal vent metagenome TaxID=652676 RepID=A0A1W1E1R7_9ZZZZ
MTLAQGFELTIVFSSFPHYAWECIPQIQSFETANFAKQQVRLFLTPLCFGVLMSLIKSAYGF